MITDNQTLKGAKTRFGNEIKVYDDGFGPLWIHRDSMGITGIVRAQTWHDAYEICEDEFFPGVTEDEFKSFVNKYAIKWSDDDAWNEGYGFRPNGPNCKGDLGIYHKDINGDRLDRLTPALLKELEITLEIENE